MIDLKWENIQNVEQKEEDFIASDYIPEKNIHKDEIVFLRTKTLIIPQKQWSQIKDNDFTSDYSKRAFVDSYFSVAVYLLKRMSSLSISANQSYRQTIEVSHTSGYRKSETSNFRIENTISAAGNADFGSLSDTLTTSYSIDKMEEYSSEDRKSTTEEVMYDSRQDARNVVFWDFVKLVAIYRRNKNNNVKLVAYNDFFIETYQKAYLI